MNVVEENGMKLFEHLRVEHELSHISLLNPGFSLSRYTTL